MLDFLQILVADDDAEDRLAVARALESSGVSAELTEVSSGKEAIERLRSGRFDCALLDNSLPDREGLPLLADLFASGVTTPIIVMSDQGSEELAVDLMKAGAVDYLSKNRVSLDHLARSIHSAVRLHRSESARRAAEHDLLDRSAQLHGLARAAIAINAAGSVERTLQTIVEQARAIIGAHQGIAGIIPETNRGGGIRAVSMSDKYAGWQDDQPRADGSGIYSAGFGGNKPLRLTQAELESDAAWREFERGSAHPPMRGCLGAPLIARDGRNLGMVQLSDKYEGDFTESDEAILVQLAQLASIAIENSRLYEAVRKAKDSAEAANASKDRFLAALSHELRTPLMPVLTTVQLLDSTAGRSVQVREGLDVIRRNIELEARLIDDLLDLTRVSKGKLQLNYDILDLHHVIASSMDICSADIGAKDLKIKLELPAGHHHVRGDAARLQQVFWNLLKNAIKFTPQGGSITVRSMDVAPSDGTGGVLRVIVRDSGIGMEPEVLERIFDAFEQADQSVTRQFGGLGLGLAISKALIGLHGGNLSAGSAGLGRGSTFTVELQTVPAPPALPARDRDGLGRARRSGSAHHAPRDGATRGDAAARAPGASRAGVNSRRSRPPSMRILLVDDHQDTNRAMARLLARMGYDVQTADNMHSALATAQAARAASDGGRTKPFDLLISDIGLPDGSGLELMRQLLQDQPIKGIALSGYGMEEDIRRSKEAGFYEHLTKPINFKRLEVTIRALAANTPQLTSETAKP